MAGGAIEWQEVPLNGSCKFLARLLPHALRPCCLISLSLRCALLTLSTLTPL